MATDASIYQGQSLPQFQTPDPVESMKNAANLRQLQLQQQTQTAMRNSYAKNMGPDGRLNQQSFLSDLGKVNPQAAMEYQSQFNKMGKEGADAQIAQADAIQKRASIFANHMNYLTGVPEDQRPQAYATVIKQLKSQGVVTPDQGIPDQYDPQLFNGFATRAAQHLGQNSADYLGGEQKKAEIAKTYSDIGQAPAKRNAELYGSRSPNAELTSQYNEQAKPIRGSQMAMAQMIDNYKNPSPQGDASLILNAYKIKFPDKPDVNSIEELTKSQSVPDTWKQMAAHSLKGGLDQGTRDNLMRDGISTFRANVDTLRGVQEKYRGRASFQNINDPTITAEPAIDKTYGIAMGLQDKIGPYVPPTERGGLLSKLFGSSGSGSQGAVKSAYASTSPAPVPQGMIRMRSPDGKVGLIPLSMKGEAIAAGGQVVK